MSFILTPELMSKFNFQVNDKVAFKLEGERLKICKDDQEVWSGNREEFEKIGGRKWRDFFWGD